MSNEVTYTKGSANVTLVVPVKDQDGGVVDLTDATLTLSFDGPSAIADITASSVSPSIGQATFTLPSTALAAIGTWECRVKAAFATQDLVSKVFKFNVV